MAAFVCPGITPFSGNLNLAILLIQKKCKKTIRAVLVTVPLIITFLGVLPERFLFLEKDLLLNLGLLVELVEVVHNDGDGERDAQHSANRAR
jgi:hypothetical protein